jgi:multicomponent Na+:H+ antiporter subunit D
MLSSHLPVLQVVVPLLTAALTPLLRERGLAWAAASAGSLCAFANAVLLTIAVRNAGSISYALGSWPAPYGIELTVDAFSALLLLIVTGASSAALLAARGSLDSEVSESRQPLLYTAWLLALGGLCGIVAAGDAFNIFVFMEISSLATYILIAGGPERRALIAVFKYLVMGTIGATFYLIGVGLIYMMTGTLNLADMAVRLEEAADMKPVLVAAGFITVGLALKAAVFPLHSWLPNAYAHAPHAVTVFVAACSTKVALYVLLRFEFVVLQENLTDHDARFTALMLPLAIVAVVAASVAALFERDLKKMLAYSSVAQTGYILFGASFVSVAGLTGGIVHMFNHALAKGTLFFAVACLAMSGVAPSRDGVAGIARRMPWAAAAFVAAGLSLIGIPGTAGFIGKWQLVLAAIEWGPAGIWVAVPILLGSLIAVLYVWRVVESMYFGVPTTAGGETPRWMVLALWGAVLANLYFGIRPELPLELAREAAAALLAGTP